MIFSNIYQHHPIFARSSKTTQHTSKKTDWNMETARCYNRTKRQKCVKNCIGMLNFLVRCGIMCLLIIMYEYMLV